ncbi:hypothetical protein [Priestia megaterium]|jgi:hypothetical protein|uniref:Uncharacterized protein n=1 Tax=Priestia megaterium TaxID=1404 RepID=A0A6M6E807_PRIMG|nr:hypothetical protein [Priestia megaterium]MED4285525.1 hypothetical protein [Priestia megaterium]QJX80677.1 hypothetical protein FDZ14_31805 [Priestia megaterium]
MKLLIGIPLQIVISLFRILFVGFLSALFCVYTVDYLLSSSFGTFNLVIIATYFATICTFAVIFVEMFYFFQRRSKKKNVVQKDKEKYVLK